MGTPVLLNRPWCDRGVINIDHTCAKSCPEASTNSNQRCNLVDTDTKNSQASIFMARINTHFSINMAKINSITDNGPCCYIPSSWLPDWSLEYLELSIPIHTWHENPDIF